MSCGKDVRLNPNGRSVVARANQEVRLAMEVVYNQSGGDYRNPVGDTKPSE